MDRKEYPSPRLEPHSRIAVVGGGPSGSFFALHALHFARQLGLPLDIVIFERKDLTAVGPRGCNMCAGILSRRVVQGLGTLGIELAPELVLGVVRTYRVHLRSHSIAVEAPDVSRRVISVYRAGGPRKSPYQPTAGLDEFLLRQAVARGARVVHERVLDISFGERPRLRTATLDEAFDLVVLASGVNATPPAFRNHNYLHPQTETMAQDALLIESEATRRQMEGTVHIFFDQPSTLIFGALIPKRHFATISLLGQKLGRDSLQQLLAVPQVAQVVGTRPSQTCGCRPRVALGQARGTYADRFVAVGDACVTRLYKDGIGSAFVTAGAAAQTAILYGISASDFRTHYAPVCRAIVRDNRFGAAIFEAIAHTKRNRIVMRAIEGILNREAEQDAGSRTLGKMLWSLFTGDADYREILFMMLNPRVMLNIALAMVRGLVMRNQSKSSAPTSVRNVSTRERME